MHCAACAVLIESALTAVDGVSFARVHYATQRARVTFDPDRTSVVALLQRIEYLGYVVDAGAGTDRVAIVLKQRHRHIWGFGLSAFCAMQIMMLTLPRFLAGGDMEPELAPLLDWAAFALVLPVIGWSARPFYRGALREFHQRRPGMDSAVALGMVSAFAGSMWHLLAGTGMLYFDSVAMFAALLLGVRWLEWEQRERNQAVIREVSCQHQPAKAERLESAAANSRTSFVCVRDLVVGDRLWIRTGEAIPVDGILESGAANLDESLLTGESTGVRRVMGEAVNSGTVNAGRAIIIRATGTAEASTEQGLMTLADNSSKPASLALSDLVARYFMPTLIVAAVATFVALLPLGIGVAAERAIAVLIISCPCALALAAPAATGRAFAGLLSRGIVLRRASALARLAKADAFLLDKTGTLSIPYVNGIASLRAGVSEVRALAIISTLERAANHPLAVALRSVELDDHDNMAATDLDWTPGEGVSGAVAGVAYRFGRAEFVGISDQAKSHFSTSTQLWLTDAAGAVGALDVSEKPRADALLLVQALQQRGSVEILSGDHPQKTQQFAKLLNVDVASGARSPEQKAARVRQLQREGCTTVMIGDGVNDSISFAGADIAVAVYGASDAARTSADVVCTRNDLTAIVEAIDYAKRVVLVVQENFIWAIGYNLIAIPAAVAGLVNPLLASVGMATSSAVVMLNVMRLGSARKGRS